MTSLLRLVGVLVVLVLSCAACGGGEDDGQAAAAAVDEFDPSPQARPRSLARLSVAAATEPEATREAALEKLGAKDPEVRLGALHALGLTLERGDSELLAPFLKSESPEERLLAASAVLSVGAAEGVPVLIDALDDERPLRIRTPSLPAWEQARFALLAFTGEDFGLREAEDLAAAAATKPAWERWWTQAEPSFEVVRAPARFSR
jgi:hypothetical protein